MPFGAFATQQPSPSASMQQQQVRINQSIMDREQVDPHHRVCISLIEQRIGIGLGTIDMAATWTSLGQYQWQPCLHSSPPR
jgi:hypothetical protein